MLNFFYNIYSLFAKAMVGDLRYSKKYIFSTGWIGGIGHPVYWIIWTYIFPQAYESFWFRFLSGFLCVPLLFYEKLPARLEKWKALYWYATVTIVIPFIFTFLLLMNDFSEVYMISANIVIFLLLYLLNKIISVISSLFLGIGLGCLLFECVSPSGFKPLHFYTFIEFSPLITFALLSGAVFGRSFRESVFEETLLSAKERERSLQALAGSIAHEMRNPLGQIKYSLDSIGHSLPIPAAKSAIQTVSTQKLKVLNQHLTQGQLAIARGLQIISMTLNEVNAKSIDPINFVYLSAVESTKKAIDAYSYETEGERHKVHMRVIQDFTFKGDETIYLFILFNLIRNALYYFRLNPRAILTITVDQATVVVRDTGPGIAENVLPQLFEPFHTSGKSGGTGLGLAYCRRTMHALGGEITCDSVYGEYTEFTLRFPVVSEPELTQRRQEVFNLVETVFKDKRILIVDDDALSRKMVHRILDKLVAQIDEAENGRLALHLLKQHHYDLIVMDLNMPVLDGYLATESIRSGIVPEQRHVPIVAYSTEPAYMARAKTQKVGMNGFISKPCGELELIQILHHVIENASFGIDEMSALLVGKTVLLAEDAEINRLVVSGYLSKYGIKVLEAVHGLALLELLESGVYCDAILMDIHMPGMDGLKAAQEIRSKASAYRSVPIIALTGDDSAVSVEAIYACGMNDFVSKPIEAVVLYEKLVQHIVRSGRTDIVDSRQTAVAATVEVIQLESDIETREVPLLNMDRMEEFKRIDLLEESLPSFSRQSLEWLDILTVSVEVRDLKQAKAALHFLTGSSGTAGARALYEFINKLYRGMGDDWPQEEGWLEKIKDIHAQTLVALAEYIEENGKQLL